MTPSWWTATYRALVFAAILASSAGDAHSSLAATRTVAQHIHGLASGRIRYPASNFPVLVMPNGQRRTVRSLLDLQRRMTLGDYAWNEVGVPPGPVWIRVDLALQTVSVFRSGHEIGTAVILYGADRKPTPPGVYPILQKAAQHRSNLYDAEMPYMLRLTHDGIAIHASNVKASYATHGCIGVPMPFARLVFDQVKRGDPVAIIGASPRR